MSSRQIVALAGAVLLAFGVFAPLVSIPIAGTMNYFANGRGDGIIVLTMAGVTALLALMRMFGGLWVTGLISAGTIAFTFYNFQSKFSQMKAEMEQQLAGNPFRGLADAALNSVQMQWGWAILALGTLLILVAAGMREQASKSGACPHCDGVVPLAQPICNHCGNGVTWIAGQPRKPSRAA